MKILWFPPSEILIRLSVREYTVCLYHKEMKLARLLLLQQKGITVIKSFFTSSLSIHLSSLDPVCLLYPTLVRCLYEYVQLIYLPTYTITSYSYLREESSRSLSLSMYF